MIIKKPQNKPLKFISKGLKITALAAMLGIGSYALTSETSKEPEKTSNPVVEQMQQAPKPKLTADGKITLALLKDIPEDAYDNAVPLYSHDDFQKPKVLLKNNTLIIVDDAPENSDMCEVTTIGTDMEIQYGYVQKSNVGEYVQINESDIESVYVVNDEKGVNLRNSPKISPETKIGGLPNGTLLLGSSKKSHEENWTNVLHFDGTSLQQGYVASEFIKKLDSEYSTDELPPLDRAEIDYTAENGKVLGMDLYDVSDAKLRGLLSGETPLPDIIQTIFNPKVNLSQAFKNTDINYAIIKLGGSQTYSQTLKKGNTNTRYKEIAAICEDYGIPYGFYYYSTAITPEEGKLEAKWICELLDELKNMDLKYHLLPPVIDVEIFDGSSEKKNRHYNTNVDQVTKAKATLTNILAEKYRKPILYTARNAADPKLSSRVMDLEQYQSLLTHGKSDIFWASPLNSKLHAQSGKQFEHYIKGKQIALDVKLGQENNYNLIDLVSWDEKAFLSYMLGEYDRQGMAHAMGKNTKESKYVAENER